LVSAYLKWVESDFKVKTVESEGVPHLEAWEYRIQRTAKLVNGFERKYRKIHALKKKKGCSHKVSFSIAGMDCGQSQCFSLAGGCGVQV
jgi:hypothetical protein